MVCRAPTSATTCAGSSPTGQVLAYDPAGRLASWQNAPGSNPTSSDAFAYDGAGQRVAQRVTINGVTTTTDYLLGGLEEVTGGTTGSTLTEYYPIPAIGTAVRVSSGSTSTLSYLASDQLGSVTVALSASGSVTAQQLYSPYGSVRYASGTMPSVTDHGYTGQIADATTGLSYYGARYYDPALGQFTSADTTSAGGLNRYAYVGGNPETATDPTGHELLIAETNGGEVGDSSETGTPDGPATTTGGSATYVGGVPAGVANSLGNVILDPDVTVVISDDGLTTTTYTELSDGEISANQVQALTNSQGQITGTQMTTQYLRAGTWYFVAAYHALHDPANDGIPAKNKNAYIPQGSGQTNHQPSSPTAPATQTGGNASGWGNGPNDPVSQCGCDPSGGRPINSLGAPYPSFIDPRTGNEIPLPSGPLARVPKQLRTSYDGSGDRDAYIKQWYALGFSTPAGGWSGVLWHLHHIRPLEFGGTNDFWNMVPLSPLVHQQYTEWWKYFC
jgi:RHS repeat-associated protein